MTLFKAAISQLDRNMKLFSMPIHTQKWQSIDISGKPEAQMRELTNVNFKAEMVTEELDYYKEVLKPNLPWADRHFVLERVSGSPINPGTTWKEWPFGNSAANFLEEGQVFSHTYAERYWPKRAGPNYDSNITASLEGVRYAYGDLGDVIKLLANDPFTRQAYLPVWFPEDTGVVHGKRVPCTLGYHFLMRRNKLDVFYPIRSCDWYRHGRDDIYLTVRLVLWMLQQLRRANPDWKLIHPGTFSMWIGSLHIFINDYNVLYAKP